MVDILGNEYRLNFEGFEVQTIEDYGDEERDSIVVRFLVEGKITKLQSLPKLLTRFNLVAEFVNLKVNVIFWPGEFAYNSIWIEVTFAEEGDDNLIFGPIDPESGCIANFLGTRDNFDNEGFLTDEEIKVITGEALHAVTRKAYNEIVM